MSRSISDPNTSGVFTGSPPPHQNSPILSYRTFRFSSCFFECRLTFLGRTPTQYPVHQLPSPWRWFNPILGCTHSGVVACQVLVSSALKSSHAVARTDKIGETKTNSKGVIGPKDRPSTFQGMCRTKISDSPHTGSGTNGGLNVELLVDAEAFMRR